MNLLQLIGVTTTWQTCSECSRRVSPAIQAHNVANHSRGFHCFRCYHIMAGVVIAPFTLKMDESGKEGK
jgi:recombinational DNA repair protein (RecF pathway)